jgi:hypothetical protein
MNKETSSLDKYKQVMESKTLVELNNSLEYIELTMKK